LVGKLPHNNNRVMDNSEQSIKNNIKLNIMNSKKHSGSDGGGNSHDNTANAENNLASSSNDLASSALWNEFSRMSNGPQPIMYPDLRSREEHQQQAPSMAMRMKPSATAMPAHNSVQKISPTPAAQVTSLSSSANNNTTSSGSGSERSSSGSGGGSGSGSGDGTRRSGGEASGEYYFAGYGSGPSLGGTSSSINQVSSVGVPQGRNAGGVAQPTQASNTGMMTNNNNMVSFASFQGAPLAASSAAAAAGPQARQNQQCGGGGLAPPNNNNAAVVGTNDEGGLPVPPHARAVASHLRHHSRHHHNTHRRTRGEVNVNVQDPIVPGNGTEQVQVSNHAALPQAPSPRHATAAHHHHHPGAFLNGIPSAIGGPSAVAARLPAAQYVSPHQRYRGTHHAHAQQQLSPRVSNYYQLRLPPSDEQAVLQRVPRTHATVVAHDLPPPPTTSDAWSSTSNGSSSRSRKRRSATRSAAAANNAKSTKPMVLFASVGNNMNDGSPSSSDSLQALAKAAAMHVTMDDPILRKKILLKQHAQPSMKLSFDSSKSEAVGSGSDEGYNASSERQSGSGSDSLSSDDAKKDKGNGFEVGVTMNEERSMALNSLSRSDSPRSSCTSLSSNGGNDLDGAKCGCAAGAKSETKSNQVGIAPGGHKRDSSHLKALLANARKRYKVEAPHAKASPANVDGFGLATPNVMRSGLSIMERSLQQKVRSAHHYHSRSTGRKMLEDSFLSAKRDLSTADAATAALASMTSSAAIMAKQGVKFHEGKSIEYAIDQRMKGDGVASSFPEAPIYSLGQDVMAQVMAFLEPPEVHSFLTTPFSKTWLITYTLPQELWKILCTSKPFYAKLDENVCGDSDASNCSFPICSDLELRHLFGRYRLLYTSFVRCMKYLNRLQDDALNGRTPSVYTNSKQNDIYPYDKNTSLKAYFAKARRLVRSNRPNGGSRSSSDAMLSITSESGSLGSKEKVKRRNAASAGAGAVTSANSGSQQGNLRLGNSMLTDRLWRPTQAGYVDNVNLPWSCAIYSVVNWMVAFADVEGIQIMCLKCLPYLLEDESQRTTAQRAGLTDSVLRAMVLFPDSIQLHTMAFHTLVLLARPLGGNEGMLFHTAMVNTRGIFNNGSSNSKNGIVIMLDSMRRFAQDEILQAMSCWSLVNVALTPLQKSMLVKLGGLTVTSNAMLQHPYNAEVQFRALFALINLVIPTETRPGETEEMREFEREIFQQLGEVGETSEKEMLDASVGQIANLVVVSMKNFCSSEAILNRACLVLHNLSLNEEYHSILLWTPNCYQMLEWCLGNYPHDHVLQQSAGGTIQRLNATLSADEELRTRFTHSIRAQQQNSLDLARQEAVLLQEQQREQEQQQVEIS